MTRGRRMPPAAAPADENRVKVEQYTGGMAEVSTGVKKFFYDGDKAILFRATFT